MPALPILIIHTSITDQLKCEAVDTPACFVKYTPSVFDPSEYVWQEIDNANDAFADFAASPEGTQLWVNKYSEGAKEADSLALALEAQAVVRFEGNDFPFSAIIKLIK